jgi:hypothetical protein
VYKYDFHIIYIKTCIVKKYYIMLNTNKIGWNVKNTI